MSELKPNFLFIMANQLAALTPPVNGHLVVQAPTGQAWRSFRKCHRDACPSADFCSSIDKNSLFVGRSIGNYYQSIKEDQQCQ